jgi:hypothetical protein
MYDDYDDIIINRKIIIGILFAAIIVFLFLYVLCCK